MTEGDQPSKGSAPSPDAAAPVTVPLDLHLCEYQALTTRITYLITMHYAFWIVGFTALGSLTFLTTPNNHFLLETVGLLVGEMLAGAFCFTSCEIYTHVCYLDDVLKAMVARDCGLQKEAFWTWETWLRDFQGGLHGDGPRWWELWPLALLTLGVLTIGYWHYGCWPRKEWYLFGAALVGLVLLVAFNRRLNRIRARALPHVTG
jgi:hypothetical protein